MRRIAPFAPSSWNEPALALLIHEAAALALGPEGNGVAEMTPPVSRRISVVTAARRALSSTKPARVLDELRDVGSTRPTCMIPTQVASRYPPAYLPATPVR